jgi:hypothetical protein
VCELGGDDAPKPKGFVQWVNDAAEPCEVRVYGHLFTEPEIDDKRWEEQLNHDSLVVHAGARIDPAARALQACRVLCSHAWVTS